jgi:hypothetical protein
MVQRTFKPANRSISIASTNDSRAEAHPCAARTAKLIPM